jgi:hypothetical protein
MKKIFAASLFLGLASLSQAAFIQCSPPQSDVVINAAGATAAFACNLGGSGATANLMGDGLAITQIRLRVSGTFQENAGTPGSTFSVLYSSTNNGAGLASGSFTLGAVNCTATGTANADGQALGACNQTSGFVAVAGNPDFISGFLVNVTGQPGSIPLPFNGSASVAYEVNTVSTVPEPATYLSLGVGLIGFYMARRRKA